MKWNDLSLDAKNVIEWLESPFTGAYKKLRITVGEAPSLTNIMITQKLFDEVLRFSTEDENICVDMDNSGEAFTIEFTEEFRNKHPN